MGAVNRQDGKQDSTGISGNNLSRKKAYIPPKIRMIGSVGRVDGNFMNVLAEHDALKKHLKEQIAAMEIGARHERYLQITKKVADLAILTAKELEELILLREVLVGDPILEQKPFP